MCIGPSMEPTIESKGQLVVINVLSYGPLFPKNKFQIGDVVIAICPYDCQKSICKRIVAVEGDTVLNETAIPYPESVRIPPGHVWLAGDNPNNSTDSRQYGPVSSSLIIGKAWFKLNIFHNFPWFDSMRLAPNMQDFYDTDGHRCLVISNRIDEFRRSHAAMTRERMGNDIAVGKQDQELMEQKDGGGIDASTTNPSNNNPNIKNDAAPPTSNQ